eukprot:14175629-Ditylum_brightwellii.AAC.1
MKKKTNKEKLQGGDKKKYRNANKQGNRPCIKPTKCKGRCEGLKEHVFDCSNMNIIDKFQVTLKEIVAYVIKE